MTLGELSTRLEKVEQDNRRLRAAITTFAMVGIGGVAMGLARPESDTVRAKSIEILDAEGRVSTMIRPHDMFILCEGGKKSISLGETSYSDSEEKAVGLSIGVALPSSSGQRETNHANVVYLGTRAEDPHSNQTPVRDNSRPVFELAYRKPGTALNSQGARIMLEATLERARFDSRVASNASASIEATEQCSSISLGTRVEGDSFSRLSLNNWRGGSKEMTMDGIQVGSVESNDHRDLLKGRNLLRVGMGEDGAPSVRLMDAAGTLRAVLGCVTLTDSRTGGETTLAPSALVLFDKEGKVIERLPR